MCSSDLRGGGGVRAAGLVGVAGLAVLIWRAPFSNEYLARLSSPLGALAATLIIVYVVHERASWLARGLAVPPLAALGRISYGVYLWHFPAFYWAGVLTANSWPAVVLGWAATLAAAGASYAIVERPALAFKATRRPGRGQRGS